MPYIKRTTTAGKTIEVEYYYTARYNKRGSGRKKKTKATGAQQEEINRKQALRKLRLLMNTNFGFGDYHLVLNYVRKAGEPCRTNEEMRQDAKRFLRECRRAYRKRGMEFRYIHVMEIGQRGARHHHLIVNRIDTKVLQECWYKAYGGHTRISAFPLDDTGQYAKLAEYFIKYSDRHLKDLPEDRLQGKRWAASRNLKRPDEKKEIITKRAWFRMEPKAKKGYYVDPDSVERGITSPEYHGYGFFRFTMIRLE